MVQYFSTYCLHTFFEKKNAYNILEYREPSRVLLEDQINDNINKETTLS